MATTENNKLIAEFMGKEYKNNAIVVSTNYITGQNPSGKVWQEPKYHNDWNWLMEVVEKIEKNFIVDIMNSAISIHEQKSGEMIVDNCVDIQKTKIQCVYIGVVEFIKWYNENTKP
jgi:hypothetical protein